MVGFEAGNSCDRLVDQYQSRRVLPPRASHFLVFFFCLFRVATSLVTLCQPRGDFSNESALAEEFVVLRTST